MLCNFFPPCGCKFGSPALIVEPLHATVQEPHEALASYVSSLAMSVWTPHSPPNLNLAYRQQEWSRIRRTKKQVENWLQGVTSWIVVHATTTVVYYTVVIVSVIVMVVVIVIVHVMVDVALSPPWWLWPPLCHRRRHRRIPARTWMPGIQGKVQPHSAGNDLN